MPRTRTVVLSLALLLPLTACGPFIGPLIRTHLLLTPLMRAAQEGDTATVQALLAKGADPNAKTQLGETALMTAAGLGHTAIVEALLAKGADPNAKGLHGITALWLAETRGYQGVVQVLKRAEAGLQPAQPTPPAEAEQTRAEVEKTRVEAERAKTEAERAKAAVEPEAPVTEEVDTPPPSKTPVNPEAYAVVIGIERYRQKGLPTAEYSDRDAQTMYAYLTRAMGFDRKNVALLQNEGATKSDLEKYLGRWLKNRATEKSRVFIYYSGHGAPNPTTGKAYLFPYDGDPNYTEDTAYPLETLYASLAKLPTQDITVVLDACFSGAGGRSVLAKGARPMVVTAENPLLTTGKTVVLAASSGSQISTSYPEGQHGLFTYFLLKGLRGDADADHDGRVTTAELFNYLGPAVEREARMQNIEQTPSLNPPPQALGDRGQIVWLHGK